MIFPYVFYATKVLLSSTIISDRVKIGMRKNLDIVVINLTNIYSHKLIEIMLVVFVSS
jgi:hypothetical protein